MHQVEQQTTADGSSTLVSLQFNQNYHSLNGAVTEATWVYVSLGLDPFLDKNISSLHVVEIGFGTGLNAYLTQQWAHQHGIAITYTCIEAYPISIEQAAQLNYPVLPLHQVTWAQKHELSPYFTFEKIEIEAEHFRPSFAYDVLFYDCFSPNTQPELWTTEVIGPIQENLKIGGILCTYCVKGDLKRVLRPLGFKLRRRPGPPGKRQVLQAWKQEKPNV
jgi:tRNA U34 5-methylaminomethyl-2-thiouridine-forming methyltransferase MnmC